MPVKVCARVCDFCLDLRSCLTQGTVPGLSSGPLQLHPGRSGQGVTVLFTVHTVCTPLYRKSGCTHTLQSVRFPHLCSCLGCLTVLFRDSSGSHAVYEDSANHTDRWIQWIEEFILWDQQTHRFYLKRKVLDLFFLHLKKL